jgi:hypothetical protein
MQHFTKLLVYLYEEYRKHRLQIKAPVNVSISTVKTLAHGSDTSKCRLGGTV